MTGIPDDDWWRIRRAIYPDHKVTPPTADLTVTDNPVTHTLLDAKGKPMRQWRERPPFGFTKGDPA